MRLSLVVTGITASAAVRLRMVTAAAALVLPQIPSASAQSISVNEPLSFGEFVINQSSDTGAISVDLAGQVTSSGALIAFAGGTAGEYAIEDTGFPFEDYDVSVNATELSSATAPPGVTFSLTDFQTNSPIAGDALGNAILRIGATLRTDVESREYQSGEYSGTIYVTVVRK